VEELDAALDEIVTSAFLVSIRAVDEFLAQGGGRIVTVCSAPRPGAIAAAARGALRGLTRTLAKEYGGRGVRANLVLAATGDDAVGPALFLAGERSSFVNGATIRAGVGP